MRAGGGFALVMVLLGPAFAGCLQLDPAEFNVPFARIGDRVEWEVGSRSATVVRLESLAPMAVQDAWGSQRPALAVAWDYVGTSPWFELPRTTVYVDAGSNQVLASKEPYGCGGKPDENCMWVLDYEREGLPWGFGSSLFQGRVFEVGRGQVATIRVDDTPVRVLLDPLRFEDHRGREALLVNVSLLDFAAPIWWEFHRIEGRYWLLDGSPYVWGAEFAASEWDEDGPYRVALRSLHQGEGEAAVSANPVDRTPPALLVWDSLYPPQAEFAWAHSRMTLSEVLDRALATSEVEHFRGRSKEVVLVYAHLSGHNYTFDGTVVPSDYKSDFGYAVFMNEMGDSLTVKVSRSEGGHPASVVTGPTYGVEVEQGGGHPQRLGQAPASLSGWKSFLRAWEPWLQTHLGSEEEYEPAPVAVLDARETFLRADPDRVRWEYALGPGFGHDGMPGVRMDASTGRLLRFTGTSDEVTAVLDGSMAFP